jgi:hypothetical protein
MMMKVDTRHEAEAMQVGNLLDTMVLHVVCVCGLCLMPGDLVDPLAAYDVLHMMFQ